MIPDPCGPDDELERLKNPAPFDRPGEPVAQPTVAHPDNVRAQRHPERHAAVMNLPDDVVWDRFSETTPPVEVGD